MASWLDLAEFVSSYAISEDEFADASEVKFNGALPEYFHPETYREILAARRFFGESPTDFPESSLVLAALLHILHGNRPYALSRRSHPITPFKPTGPSVYKPLVEHVRTKVERVLRAELPSEYVEGEVRLQDATTWWPQSIGELDAVITSPPFFDSTRFHVQNWMRLWFTGWEAADFVTQPKSFVDERQKNEDDVYDPIMRQAAERLRPDGVVVFHLGRSRKQDMAAKLAQRATTWFTVADVYTEDVGHLESHGIRDKGTVTDHTYLVLRR